MKDLVEMFGALAKKEEKYTVYEVESNKVANEKLKKVRNCIRIEELNIIGHGKIGSINLVSINDSMREQDGYGNGVHSKLPAGGFLWFFSAPDFKSDIKTNINYAF
ncbi:MAG: hypothetical protein PHO36_15850 [Parabacteroides sp.]|nr:hypothetical protein [Parabacteroides sp.]